MGIGKKITKGSMGGGVNISHKSKMSQSAKNQMGFSNGMPGPNVVSRGMAQYIAGEAVGVKKIGKKVAYKLGDLSVKAGIDNNPEVTRADVIVGAKKKSPKQMGEMEEAPMSTGPAKKQVKSVKEIGRAKLSSEAEGEMINSNFVSNDPKAKTLNTTIKPKLKRKPSKEIGKSKIEEGKKLKKEGRQEKRAARKDARKSKRSARLDKKIALQEFKGKQKLKSGDKLGAKAKRDRIANLKARKAKK